MSKIEWTEKTWNPVVGCRKVSAGCTHCYAEKMAGRLKAMGLNQYQTVIDENGRWSGEVGYAKLGARLERNFPAKPMVYFVGSMTDIFYEKVPDTFIAELWKKFRDNPQHTFQVLTKRGRRMRSVVTKLTAEFGILPNVWVGVSVENQEAADSRVEHLINTPSVVKFLSCEPLLGQTYIPYMHYIDWVIVGGESGAGARPMNPYWVEYILNQCKATGTKFFFKQWGAWKPLTSADEASQYPKAEMHDFSNARMVRVGKHLAGKKLFGRTFQEFPKVNKHG